MNKYLDKTGLIIVNDTFNEKLSKKADTTSLNDYAKTADLAAQQLTDEDLNTLRSQYFNKIFYAGGPNQCTNVPPNTNTTGFGLLIYQSAGGGVTQIAFNTAGLIWIRGYHSGKWSVWKELGGNVDLSSLQSQIDGKVDKVEGSSLATEAQLAQIETNKTDITGLKTATTPQILTNTDLNTLQGADYWGKSYYAAGRNTCANVPGTAGRGFVLMVLRNAGGCTTQIYSEAGKNTLWVRGYLTSWSEWAELGSGNVDLSSLQSQIDGKADKTELPTAMSTEEVQAIINGDN